MTQVMNKYKLYRFKIMRISFTVINFLIVVIMPLFNYFNFKRVMIEDIDLSNFESRYDSIILWDLLVGVLMTVCTYMLFHYPKHSVKRGIIALIYSILFSVFLLVFSQMSIIHIKSKYAGIILDLERIFIILILVSCLFIIKNIYDLIDFKLNQTYYERERKKKIIKFLKDQGLIKSRGVIKKFNLKSESLIKCPNPKCNYMCRPDWRKCPLCKTKITKTINISSDIK